MCPARAADDLPVLVCADPEAWTEWLRVNQQYSKGVWLKIAKKGSPTQTVTYVQALEVAICHGWIDGQKAAHDDSFWLQRFTPRGPRSKWSQINREKASEQIAAGRMSPAGLAQVQAAQRDGRWQAAYEPQSRATVPEDFRRALDKNPRAQEFFAGLTGANRYAFLYRIGDAKRPETRAKRIADYVAMCSEHR